MRKIVLDTSVLQIMSLFEQVTRAQLKDCIALPELIVFVVLPNELGKAVGVRGRNVQNLAKLLKKKIRIVEYQEDCISFIKGLLYPIEVKNIVIEDDVVVVTAPDVQSRGVLIGRNAERLRMHEAIVKRYFSIKEMRVK